MSQQIAVARLLYWAQHPDRELGRLRTILHLGRFWTGYPACSKTTDGEHTVALREQLCCGLATSRRHTGRRLRIRAAQGSKAPRISLQIWTGF